MGGSSSFADNVPEAIYRELPYNLQREVEVDRDAPRND